jgi:RNA polymerase sigma factor (sigma-70 family)
MSATAPRPAGKSGASIFPASRAGKTGSARRARIRAFPAPTASGDGILAVVAALDRSPEEAAIATETAALVTEAVGRLPPQQRAVLVLRVWDGLSYTEIAEVVGRTEAAVRSHMHHGLAAMRRYLEPRLG